MVQHKCEYINIETWYEPLNLLNKEKFMCEMSYEDLGFLCGLIKTKNLKKS